ncbi:papain-like cysteine peptidase [Campylobacter helveticus]|uniref:papain-like cysteine peptidase n=1 Tax=Campylobacter helveticus TaxID=28898 RepID=UPI00214C9D18|nr:papain-like cysteine peptidase [Campylobacter helveticus]MCR2059391.1 papain-like cysteine peptidase [Campylobacter helveticus]
MENFRDEAKSWRLIFKFFKRRKSLKADVFISVGAGCKVAFYLKKFKLRTFSSPFDWLGLYTLVDINVCFEQDFANFFKDYEEVPSTTNKRWVRDRQNGMRSMHDFSFEESLDEGYERFITQKRRRFENLKRHIKASKHICFVSCRQGAYEEFENFLGRMQNFHKAKYTLINIRHDESQRDMERFGLEWGGRGDLSLIEYRFNDIHPKGEKYKRAWLGNVKFWREIMRHLSLN